MEEDVQNMNDKVSLFIFIFIYLFYCLLIIFFKYSNSYITNKMSKLTKLQEQIEILTEAQLKNDIKYTSMKRENINLNDK